MKAVWNLVMKFFNTPIKRYGIDGKEIIDNSPRFSMVKGIFIILGGAVVVVVVLIFIFGFILA